MGTTSTYFGGSGGGATAAPVISNNTRIKGLTYLGTTNIASHNSSNVNTPYITSMNDTHFVIFAKDSSSNGYVRLFSVDDTGTTTAVNNAWVQIGTGGSVNDMDGIGCGNGYRDCFIGYRNGSNNRILKLSWDGSSGISTNNALNRTGQGSPLNNASCFIDGTMAAQVYDQGGNIYWTHYSLSGDSGQSSSGFSGSPTSGFCGS